MLEIQEAEQRCLSNFQHIILNVMPHVMLHLCLKLQLNTVLLALSAPPTPREAPLRECTQKTVSSAFQGDLSEGGIKLLQRDLLSPILNFS